MIKKLENRDGFYFCKENLFVYLDNIFLELYEMLDVPNAEEEYKKRKLFLNI